MTDSQTQNDNLQKLIERKHQLEQDRLQVLQKIKELDRDHVRDRTILATSDYLISHPDIAEDKLFDAVIDKLRNGLPKELISMTIGESNENLIKEYIKSVTKYRPIAPKKTCLII
jgi:hypothetical protein